MPRLSSRLVKGLRQTLLTLSMLDWSSFGAFPRGSPAGAVHIAHSSQLGTYLMPVLSIQRDSGQLYLRFCQQWHPTFHVTNSSDWAAIPVMLAGSGIAGKPSLSPIVIFSVPSGLLADLVTQLYSWALSSGESYSRSMKTHVFFCSAESSASTR